MKPRPAAIIRRFLDGASFYDLQEEFGVDLDDIERAIRNALNRPRKKR